MAKPEWGVKRLCQSCATKFYDLGRSPIACPQCGARFDPEALLKSRRNRPTAAARPAKPPPKAPEVDKTGRPDNKAPGQSSVDPGGDDGDDISVIEDTSELSDAVVTGSGKDD